MIVISLSSFKFYRRPSPTRRMVLLTFLLILSTGCLGLFTPQHGCNPLLEFKCDDVSNGTICIPWAKVKDGVADCPHGTDEACEVTQFNCGSGQPLCIDLNWVYNGRVDCQDGIDEGCPSGSFICEDKTGCIPALKHKDGVRDCADGSDEKCEAEEYQCRNSTVCIPKLKFQDGFNDCGDGSDEECLPTQHECLCGFPRCLDAKFVKDGVPDCIEGSDEGHIDKESIVCPDEDLQGLLAVERRRRTSEPSGNTDDTSVTVEPEDIEAEGKTEGGLSGEPEVLIKDVFNDYEGDGTTEHPLEDEENRPEEPAENGYDNEEVTDSGGSPPLVIEIGSTTPSAEEVENQNLEEPVQVEEKEMATGRKLSDDASVTISDNEDPHRTTLVTSVTYYNQFNADGQTANVNSTTAITNVVLMASTDQLVSTVTKTLTTSKTNTYFSTETLFSNNVKVHTSREVNQQIIVSKAPVLVTDSVVSDVPTIAPTKSSTIEAVELTDDERSSEKSKTNSQDKEQIVLTSKPSNDSERILSRERQTPSMVDLLLRTYYTTYTYFTTYLVGDETSIESTTELESNVVTETVARDKTDVTTGSFISTTLPPNQRTRLKTLYTTITYLTTFLEGSETTVTSNLVTESSIITETVNGKNTELLISSEPLTSLSSPVSSQPVTSEAIKPTVSNSISNGYRTLYTTFTYFTTFVEGTETVVSSSKETVTNTVPITKSPEIQKSSSVKPEDLIEATPTSSIADIPTSSIFFQLDDQNKTIVGDESFQTDSTVTVNDIPPPKVTTKRPSSSPNSSVANNPAPSFPLGPVLTGLAGLLLNGGLALGASSVGAQAPAPIISNRNDSDRPIFGPGNNIAPPNNIHSEIPMMKRPQSFGNNFNHEVIRPPNYIPVGNFAANRFHAYNPTNPLKTDKFTRIDGPLLEVPHPGYVINFQQTDPMNNENQAFYGTRPAGFRPGPAEKGFTPLVLSETPPIIPVFIPATREATQFPPLKPFDITTSADINPTSSSSELKPSLTSSTTEIDRSIINIDDTPPTTEISKSSDIASKDGSGTKSLKLKVPSVTTVTSILQGQSTVFFSRPKPASRNTELPAVSLIGSDSDEIAQTRYPSISTVINAGTTTYSTVWIHETNPVTDVVAEGGLESDQTEVSVIDSAIRRKHTLDDETPIDTTTFQRVIRPSTTTFYTTYTYFTTTFIGGNPIIQTRKETSEEIVIMRPGATSTEITDGVTKFTHTLQMSTRTGSGEGFGTEAIGEDVGAASVTVIDQQPIQQQQQHQQQQEFINLRNTVRRTEQRQTTIGPEEAFIRATTTTRDFPADPSLIQGTFSTSFEESRIVSGADQGMLSISQAANQNQGQSIRHLVQQDEQTHYTITHFYTEIGGQATPVVVDRQEVSTEIITLRPSTLTIEPKEVTRTYFTTYYYYTTSMIGDQTVINSRAETQSQVITLGPFTATDIRPTASFTGTTNIVGDTTDIVGGAFQGGGQVQHEQHQEENMATYRTRYTYYTTYLRQGQQSITSNIITYTQVVPRITSTAFFYESEGAYQNIRPTVVDNRATGIVTRLPEGEVTAYRVLDGSRTVLFVDNGAIRTQLGSSEATRVINFGQLHGGQQQQQQIDIARPVNTQTITITETVAGEVRTSYRYITPQATTRIVTQTVGGGGLEFGGGGGLEFGGGATTRTRIIETPPLRTEFVTRVESTGRTVIGTKTSIIYSVGVTSTQFIPFTTTLIPRTMVLTIVGGRRTYTNYLAATEESTIRATETVRYPIFTTSTQTSVGVESGGITFEHGKTTEESTFIGQVNIGETVNIAGTPSTSKPEIAEAGSVKPFVNVKCPLYCNDFRMESCRFQRGQWKCGCRPGQGRVDGTRTCENVITYELLINFVREGRRDIIYSDELKDEQSKRFQSFASKCELGLARALSNSQASQVFRGDYLVTVDDSRLTNANWNGVVARVAVNSREESSEISRNIIRDEIVKSLQKSNYTLDGTDLVVSPSAEAIRIQDMDECARDDLNDCSSNATCINKEGSFSCLCREPLLDTDEKNPGRNCAEAITAVCDYCSYQGECVKHVNGDMTCNCYPWHLGERCQINGLALAIILPLLLALLLLPLLIWCCCRRKKRRAARAARAAASSSEGASRSKRHSNLSSIGGGTGSALSAGGVFPRFGGSIDHGQGGGTLDKKAMLTEDSASESSGEQSRFAHVADAFGAKATSMEAHRSKNMSYEQRNLSAFADVPPVVIPRAKHQHPKQYGSSSTENIIQRSEAELVSAENKLIDILEGEHSRSGAMRKEASTFSSTLPHSKSKYLDKSHSRSATVDRSETSRHEKRAASGAMENRGYRVSPDYDDETTAAYASVLKSGRNKQHGGHHQQGYSSSAYRRDEEEMEEESRMYKQQQQQQQQHASSSHRLGSSKLVSHDGAIGSGSSRMLDESSGGRSRGKSGMATSSHSYNRNYYQSDSSDVLGETYRAADEEEEDERYHHRHHRSGHDSASSGDDANSYGRYGTRTVSEVRSCDETTVHPATRHLGAGSYYSSSKGKSSRYARSRTEEGTDPMDADENVTDVSVSTMMVPNALIYYKEDSDYSESSDNQSMPSPTMTTSMRSKDVVYDPSTGTTRYEKKSYYSYERTEKSNDG
ncbi:hypothetical protein CHUAL_006867 [Chamberlinius hualienensis]